MIYLDNAATTGKKPLMVIKSVERALTIHSANPGRGGHKASVSASEEVFKVREKVALMFGAKGEDRVIFTPSCTVALNFAIKGVLNKGDHIIISSMEHNAVTRPTETLKKMGIEVSVAEVIFSDSDATFRSFERAIKPNTKAIVCTHASNVTGEVMPIEKIGELARNKGIIFIVDAAQTGGVLPIDTKKMNIDFLCIAPHKGLYAPMGTGILIANGDIEHTVIEGGTGVNSAMVFQPDEYPERMESGTLNLPGILGISGGIDFVRQKGMTNIYKAEMELIRRLYSGLSKISGAMVYASYPTDYDFVPVLSFNIQGLPSSYVCEKLDKFGIAVRGGLHCAPFAHKRIGTLESGTVRVSPAVFNTKNDIDRLLNGIELISKHQYR